MGVVWDILESLFSSLGNEVSRRTGDTINSEQTSLRQSQ